MSEKSLIDRISTRASFRLKDAVLWALVLTQFTLLIWVFLAMVDDIDDGAAIIWPALLGIGITMAVGGVVTAFSFLPFFHHQKRGSDLLGEAFRALPHPRLIVGPDGEGVFVNPAFKKFFYGSQDDWADQEYPGHSMTSPFDVLQARLSSGEDGADALSGLVAVADSGGTGQADMRIKDADDYSKWVSVSVNTIPDRPGYVLWAVEDITDRHLMGEIIRQEQEALFEFVENSPVGFYSVNGEGRFHLINRTLAGWLGSTPEEILEGDFCLHDFVVSDIPAGTPPNMPSAEFQERELGGGVAEDDASAQADDVSTTIALHDGVLLCGRQGRVLHVEISQIIISDRQGGSFTRSVIHDVTQERELEWALRQAMLRFQKFFKAAPGGIAQLDIDGRIIECNPALQAMLGDAWDGSGGTRQDPLEEAPDITGRLLTDFIAPSQRGRIEAMLADIVSGSDLGASVEVNLADPDEGESARAGAFFASRLEGDDGELTGLILHGLDTTEQKHLELQFSQSQKMQAVGQLAGGIAHDFNNLLTAMIGFCDLLLQRHNPGEQSFADVMQIKQNANRAANLVRQLLAFSRQQTVRPTVVNVTEVLVELSHLLRRLIGETIELNMKHGRDLGRIKADQGQLEQVIVNLVVNARDAMPGGGQLSIRTDNVTVERPVRYGVDEMPRGDYILIEISDTGGGIDKDHLEHIFEPFYSTKEVGAGTGLGLSTVHGIVKQSEGFVFVNSVLGKGTTFSIFLPFFQSAEDTVEAAARAAAEQPSSEGSDLTGFGTILLVEDEDAVRLFSARALRNKGYNVLEARSGNTAVELLGRTSEPVNLLITDVVMPDMDGPALVKWFRENRPGIKIICISGYAEESFRNNLEKSDDIHFLSKPFSLKQLAGKVKEVLGGAVAGRDAEDQALLEERSKGSGGG